jgi:hypothetical protein
MSEFLKSCLIIRNINKKRTIQRLGDMKPDPGTTQKGIQRCKTDLEEQP